MHNAQLKPWGDVLLALQYHAICGPDPKMVGAAKIKGRNFKFFIDTLQHIRLVENGHGFQAFTHKAAI